MDSKIINFFVYLIRKTILLYDNSIISKLIDRVVNYLKLKFSESLIVEKVINRKDNRLFLSNSVIIRIIVAPFNFIRKQSIKIIEQTVVAREESLFLQPLNKIISQILKVSVRFYGIILMSSSLFILVFSIILKNIMKFDYITRNAMVALGFFFVVGVLCVLINKSIYSLLCGSTLLKMPIRLINKINIITEKIKLQEQSNDFNISYWKATILGIIFAILCGIVSPIYVVVGIIGIFGSAIILKKTLIGVFLIAGLAPFLPTMGVLALVIITFASFLLKCVSEKKFKFKFTELGLPIILLVLVFGYSMITSFSVKADLNVFLITSIFILFYFVFINIINTKRQLFIIISLMIWASLIVAMYGIYQNFTGGASNVWTDQEMFGDIAGRVTSTLSNPNVLGEYLIILIPLCLAMIAIIKDNVNKFIYAGIAGVLAICLVFTYSRGCWIGILVGLIIFFVFVNRRFISLGFVGLLMLPVFLPTNIINRFTSIGNLQDTSSSYRLSIWIGAIKMLKDYWLAGIGLSSEAFLSIFSLYSYNGVIAQHPHNLYLQFTSQIGIVGLIIFLIIMIKMFRLSIIEVIKTKSRQYFLFILSVISAASAFLVQSMFDNTWYNYRIILIFIILISIGIKIIMLSREERTEERIAIDDKSN